MDLAWAMDSRVWTADEIVAADLLAVDKCDAKMKAS